MGPRFTEGIVTSSPLAGPYLERLTPSLHICVKISLKNTLQYSALKKTKKKVGTSSLEKHLLHKKRLKTVYKRLRTAFK